jgi:hypothetical protein
MVVEDPVDRVVVVLAVVAEVAGAGDRAGGWSGR